MPQNYSQLQENKVLFLCFEGVNQLKDVVMFYPLKGTGERCSDVGEVT